MKVRLLWSVALIVGGLSVIGAGCASSKTPGSSGIEDESQPFGTPMDWARAESLWHTMRNYQNWSAYPALAGMRRGQSPHGEYIKYYVNPVAARYPTGHGAIIVKENFANETEDSLTSVTVMEKIGGYDPRHADWFWVQFSPQGDVAMNETGTRLAGRLAFAEGGCIDCHRGAAGGDLLFANDR